jgi:hypothetical protein
VPAFRPISAIACLAVLLASASLGAQPNLTVLSLDELRTDRGSGERRHEILPVAVFDGAEFTAIEGTLSEANAARERLLAASPSAQVLYRGRRIGVVDVSDIYPQRFHCIGLVVGSGAFEPNAGLPESEITDSVRGWVRDETIDYATESFFAISGATAARPDGDALVTVVDDPAELERYAMDIASIEPRTNLLPLGEDETRVYRLDRYDAAVVVRKRRSAALVPGPADLKLQSPLMTDIVMVRNIGGEHAIHPLYRSVKGTDAWGKGEPDDRFMDAFELGDGTVYLAFHRRNYEAQLLQLFRLEANGATRVLQTDLYGC